MEPIAEKRDALKRAEELLARNDDQLLRYAALELRRCIEAVVYEKLWAYRERLPDGIAKTWQPPQAFRALAQLEPRAQYSSTISIALQKEQGIPSEGPYHVIGRDHRPDPSWLTKRWNKLGSLLHATSPFTKAGAADAQSTRQFLESVAAELHPFVDRSFTSTLAEVATFDCSLCGKTIIANVESAKERGTVTCLNGSCGATYFADLAGDEARFRLDALTATCPDCGTTIPLPPARLRVGYEFSCPKCSEQFKVTSEHWNFEKASEPDPDLGTREGDT